MQYENFMQEPISGFGEQNNMLKKNDEIILTIEDMGADGEGIGRYEGMTFFVKDALIGDVVRAGVTRLKKTYGYARIVEIMKGFTRSGGACLRFSPSVRRLPDPGAFL